ncbi:MAG: Rrf2 family transcriptional regulator [Bacteroidetes bacterium]|nr:Rrf2 family transcriptional regulator [Bacteroidota bacterium]
MKFSSQEEYGLRCLLQLARSGPETSMTIAEISEAERLSQAYVAKLLRILRLSGLVESARGQEGGYTLARPVGEIILSDVLAALGGRFYKPGFCDHFSGTEETCTHTFSCSIRPLWRRVQTAIDSVLGTTTLADLLDPEAATPEHAALTLRPSLIPRESIGITSS